MKTIVKEVKYLSAQEYKALYGLNMRGHGMMQPSISWCRKNQTGTVVIVYDNNVVVSWSLLFVSPDTDEITAYFYTRKKCRRKGYGSLAAEVVKNNYNNIVVDPWNDASKSFFKKNGIN